MSRETETTDWPMAILLFLVLIAINVVGAVAVVWIIYEIGQHVLGVWS